MGERSDADKIDEIMLPGFRFHPTDEELVGFYLRRKIQQRPLTIELIKQLDIYKYDPWDLPKLATTGEKEWYFYCPRDRKYRNSTRPNRVTGAGFWKATGTDRPVYSSEGSKCIGLKKSLVFYKGRAAKGIKTDWMMHEFRLPSLTDSVPPKRYIDKAILANDSWAICRIFKKTNSTTQRALSHSWVSTLPENTLSSHSSHLSSDHIPSTDFSSLENNPSYRLVNPAAPKPSQLPFPNGHLNTNAIPLSPCDAVGPAKCTVDASSLLLNMSSSMLGDFCKDDAQYNGFSFTLPQGVQGNMDNGDDSNGLVKTSIGTYIDHHDQCMNISRSMGFPFGFPLNVTWDSSPSSELSTNYSTNKVYS